jgi:hypothetical protein
MSVICRLGGRETLHCNGDGYIPLAFRKSEASEASGAGGAKTSKTMPLSLPRSALTRARETRLNSFVRAVKAVSIWQATSKHINLLDLGTVTKLRSSTEKIVLMANARDLELHRHAKWLTHHYDLMHSLLLSVLCRSQKIKCLWA